MNVHIYIYIYIYIYIHIYVKFISHNLVLTVLFLPIWLGSKVGAEDVQGGEPFGVLRQHPWYSSQFQNKCLAESCSGSEEGSYSRLIDCCITQLSARE